MRWPKHKDKAEESHEHDKFLLFLSFLATAIIGYLISNHVALLGV